MTNWTPFRCEVCDGGGAENVNLRGEVATRLCRACYRDWQSVCLVSEEYHELNRAAYCREGAVRGAGHWTNPEVEITERVDAEIKAQKALHDLALAWLTHAIEMESARRKMNV